MTIKKIADIAKAFNCPQMMLPATPMKKIDRQKYLLLLDIATRVLALKPSAFNDSLKIAVNSGRITEAVSMVRDQISQGHRQTMEWEIGNTLLSKMLLYAYFISH